jgi:hypothetical protein
MCGAVLPSYAGLMTEHQNAEDRPAFIQTLVLNAIRRRVADAIRSGSVMSAAECAAEILRTYPSCGMAAADIANEAMMAAARAGVPIEIGAGQHRTAA